MLIGTHTPQRITSLGSDFRDRHHKDGEEFQKNIARVASVEIWGSFVTVKMKRQWKSTRSLNNLKMLKQTLSACQKLNGKCFLGQQRSADYRIHGTRGQNNVRNVLQDTKNATEQKAWNADIRFSAPS
jgi:hypothetical protein